ncbi:nonstructural protein 1 [Chestnut teal chaphamaparvovirus 3]|uniref:Nonstructural protein 1 n=1 Tax=Chestnut teal chaphamaparvovirus 3 TaxID=2759405 RepID=A0A7D7AGQ9_9VIRU|nr:nonstructural protein 1 [Chestnut teal chaphamaparvovirus 3]QMI57837.1 nonstructural protein 1 [Chestnut teal chaphamaparvovirus 3]
MQKEVSSSRHSVRRFLWRSGDGTDLGRILATDKKTEEIITEERFEPRPLSVYELEEKLYNAKQWIGAVIMIGTDEGHVVDDLLAYAVLLNAMACNEGWIAAGDVNKDGVFHVHCICKTGVRQDSWKRTLNGVWNTFHKHALWFDRYGVTHLDVNKAQRVHRYSALMQYICKNPTWIVSNKMQYLQQTVDIDAWGLSKRFQKEDPEKTDISGANPMVSELLEIITQHNCKSLEDLIKASPETAVKYLHRPTFGSIVQNCIAFAKTTGAGWHIKNFAKYEADPSGIHGIILTQGINVQNWDYCIYQWLCKTEPKRNTLYIEGPSNTGKTTTFYGLKQICPHGEIVNGLTFNFEGLLECYWGLWDEPLCAPEVVEKFKQISGGEVTKIPVKFKKPMTLPRTPILVCTNTPLWRWCPNEEQMLKNRMFMFRFTRDVSNGLFIPRCIETSCGCRYCTISRRGQTAASSSTATRSMPESEQPGTSGKFMDAGNENTESELGTRSMSKRTRRSKSTDGSRRARRGGQSSYSTTRRSSSSSTSSSRGSSPEHGSSSTRERICDTRSGSTQSMDADGSRGSIGNVLSSTERRSNRSDGNRTDSESSSDSASVVSMGGTRRKRPKMVNALSSEKQQMDREMAPMKLQIPGKEQWQKYLSYLWLRFKEAPLTSLQCTEQFLSSDSE